MQPASVATLLRAGRAQLLAALADEARLASELLLAHALGRDRAWLLANGEAPVDRAAARRYQAGLTRAARCEPLAHILGRREFFALEFAVNHHVLVPRPETELLVEMAIAWCRAHRARRGAWPSVVDVGTGSGAIAVSLAHSLPGLRLLATDVSLFALAMARRNARRHGVAGQVSLCRVDLLPAGDARYQLVCANLPYLSPREWEEAAPAVRCFEPALALRGGAGGLQLVARLLGRLKRQLAPGGLALLEIGSVQAEAALSLAGQQLSDCRLALLTDLAGLPRLLRLERPA